MLLQICCKGTSVALVEALPSSGRQCQGGRAVAAVLVLEEATGTSVEKFTAQHLPCIFSSFYVRGKGKALTNRVVKGGKELIFLCMAVKAGGRLEFGLFQTQ